MSGKKKPQPIGFYLAIIFGVVILANNVLQSSKFLLENQLSIIVALFISSIIYMLARDSGYNI